MKTTTNIPTEPDQQANLTAMGETPGEAGGEKQTEQQPVKDVGTVATEAQIEPLEIGSLHKFDAFANPQGRWVGGPAGAGHFEEKR